MFYRVQLVLLMLLLGACAITTSKQDIAQEKLDLVKLYYDKALYSEAERLLLELDKTAPNNYDINFRLGNIYVRTGQFAAADQRYRRCIDIDGAEPKGWYNLSLLKIKEAIAIAEEGQSKSRLTDPEFAKQFTLLRDGLIHSVTGK